MSSVKDRIYGCLIGVAAGDAMGMPTSMMSPQMIRAKFNHYITDFLPAPEGHLIHGGMIAGQVTDDTQQTLVLADSIISRRCIDPEDIARGLIAWAEEQQAFESKLLGPSSLRALHSIRNGEPLASAGAVGDTNGASMRIGAVGIFGGGDLSATVEAVTLACMPTHYTNIAISGASAVAMTIGCGICGIKNVNEILELALQAAEFGMTKGNIWYGASIIERTRLAFRLIESGSDKERVMQDLYNIIGTGVATPEAVPACLAIVKLAEGDPVEAIQIATNLGGDCDTTAAIAGGMCGAIAGAGAFPQQWIDLLEEVNQLNLENYAESLYQLVAKKYSRNGSNG